MADEEKNNQQGANAAAGSSNAATQEAGENKGQGAEGQGEKAKGSVLAAAFDGGENKGNNDGKAEGADKKAADGKAATDAEKAAAEAKAKEEADKKAAEEKAKGAPEKYADFKAPEGMELNKEVLGKFAEVAKKLNLSQEAAQAIVDVGGEQAKAIVAEATKGFVKQQADAWKAQRDKWAEQLTKNKEWGGANEAQTKTLAIKAMQRFGSPALKEFFNHGFGDNDELIIAFAKVGKALGEDSVVEGSKNGAEEGNVLKKMYPSLQSKK